MNAAGNSRNIIQGQKYRITLITDQMIRFEYQEDGLFTDLPSQMVWKRDLGEVPFTCQEQGGILEINTGVVKVTYEVGPFTDVSLKASLIAGNFATSQEWFYGKKGKNLGGTARTLDEANGEIPLEPGISAFDGFAVLEDHQSILLTEDGWIMERPGDGLDFYLFAYGQDYKAALKDFYKITGKTPMLPRYALGNWWSRYYAYTQAGYEQLMDDFRKEEVPFSVAVIDMDWHWVQIDPKYGDGWTGYSWNTDLFPDPEGFMQGLHDRGMKVTLNVHPALGVRAHEDMYVEMAERMGIDPASEEAVGFDITSPEFLKAYFEIIHHPHEEKGVDFWWIDWQQGTHTSVKGLDPLWMLNHYHFLDSARNGKRPMTFSRYAGPGSHRYPVGFSGDTVISWESLDFQPYFTFTASNIGYGWWSHDIGGHMLGYRDDVMEARWVQFGVFSPINRLHSSNSEFSGKEPWNFRTEVRNSMDEALRLRHRMIPYLYTMNHRAYAEDEPLLQPMYYNYPESFSAYPKNPFTGEGSSNQYLFGTDFLISPITTDLIDSVNMGKVRTWIPDGIYHDFFTGLIYRGEKTMDLYRSLDSIPALVRAGGIVPLTDEIFGQDAVKNPTVLDLRVYGGADGDFVLYEDDNETTDYEKGICVTTHMEFDWTNGIFTIHAPEGKTDLIPEGRRYRVSFMGIRENTLVMDGETKLVSTYDERMGMLTVELPVEKGDITIRFEEKPELNDNHIVTRVREILNCAQIEYMTKDAAYRLLQAKRNPASVLSGLLALELDPDVYGAIAEVLSADLD